MFVAFYVHSFTKGRCCHLSLLLAALKVSQERHLRLNEKNPLLMSLTLSTVWSGALTVFDIQ